MSNFGSAGNLVIGGKHYDTSKYSQFPEKDEGSIIMLIATDIPLSERQLKRVSKRAMISLGRVGSYCGDGSGDIAITFTPGNRLKHYSEKNILGCSGGRRRGNCKFAVACRNYGRNPGKKGTGT